MLFLFSALIAQYLDARQEKLLNCCATGASTGLDGVDIKLKKTKQTTRKKQILFACNAWSQVSVSPVGTSGTPESETNIRVRENNYEKKIQISEKDTCVRLRLERNKEMEEIRN